MEVATTTTVRHSRRPVYTHYRYHHVLTDIEGAMRITGKAKPTIYANARKGIIPHYKRGNKLYFYEDELYKWIEGGKQDCYGINSEEMLKEIRQRVHHLPSNNR